MKTLAGIEATGVEQRNGVLVFSGEYFLDEQGLPTPKSTAVFNMFKYAHTLSEKYHGRLTQNARHWPRVLFSSGFVRVASSGVAGDPRFRPRCS